MPPQAPWATRSARFVRLVVTLAVVLTGTAPGAGCARLGFSEQASAARDGGLDGTLDGPGDSSADAPDGDAVSVDATLAGLNEPCSPGGCIPGLVCTGTPGNLHCRKGCGDGGCPDSEVCGRPVGVTTVPMACLSNKTASQHEDCSVVPCSAGLYCLKGNGGAVCFKGCTSDSDCGANESCATNPLKHCMPRCKSDADCPNSLFHCVGVGPYPYDHCAPLIPVGPHAVCTAKIYCGPGYRCTGQANQTKHCYKTCPASSGGTCLTNELCYKNLSGVEFCLRSCAPLDSPVKCRSTETCYADPDLLKAYCIPAKGDATTCTSTVPCVSGKLCVNNSCKPACDNAHPCKTGTCSTLKAGSKTLPWKACN